MATRASTPRRKTPVIPCFSTIAPTANNAARYSSVASWHQPQAPSAETLNRWNRDKRFGQAYLDAGRDPALAWDVNLAHGISPANWQDTVAVWIDTMAQYGTFLYENTPAAQ